MRLLFLPLLASCFLAIPVSGQVKNSSVLLSAAIYEEEVSGNLEKASGLYLQLLNTKGIDRPVAAGALYHLGLVSEKMGRKKADEYYNRLIDNYPEQKELVAMARVRLTKTKNPNLFTDSRDGHCYRFVTIGSQTWMAENLAYLDHVNPMKKQEGGIWVYGYDGRDTSAAKASHNYQVYGCLYDWATAMGLDSSKLDRAWQGESIGRQGICPPGWHLPIADEWKVLKESQAVIAGKSLKASRGWSGPGLVGNPGGFDALPGGFRQDAPPVYFTSAGDSCTFWNCSDSSPEEGILVAQSVILAVEPNELIFSKTQLTNGLSVRCIKDLKSAKSGASEIETKTVTKSLIPAQKIRIQSKIPASQEHTPGKTPGIAWTLENYSFNGRFIASGGKVFFTTTAPILQVLDVQTGKEIWTYNDLGFFNRIKQNLFDGKVFVERYYPDGIYTMLGIDTTDHQKKWQFPLDRYTPDFAVSNGFMVCYEDDGTINVIDLKASQKVWSKKPGGALSTQLTLFKNLLVAGIRSPIFSGDHAKPTKSYLYAYDLQTGSEKWKFSASLPFNGMPAMEGNAIFIGSDDNYLYSIDLLTGQKRWRFYSGKEIREGPAVANGMVFIGSTDNYFYALDQKTGREIWRYAYICSGLDWQPAISDSLVLFTGKDKWLYAVDIYTGIEKWKYRFANDFFSGPVVMDGIILIVSGNTLHGLR